MADYFSSAPPRIWEKMISSSAPMMPMPVLPGVPSGSQPIVSQTYSSGSQVDTSGDITGMNLLDDFDGFPI